MGTVVSKARVGGSAAKYVAEEASKASKEAVTEAFTELSDSERQRVMEALHTANMSKATTSGRGAVQPAPTPATKISSSDAKNEERKVLNFARECKKLNEQIAATSVCCDAGVKSKLVKRLEQVEKQIRMLNLL